MLPEAYYLRCLMEAYHAGLRSPQKLAPSHFVTISEYVDFNRSVVSSYLEHIRQRYSRTKRIVLKEPDLTKYFPQLHQLCHDAQFICMVRDPRDTVSSILNVFLRKLEQGAEDYQSSLAQSRDVEQICHYCISFYKPLFSNSSADLWNRTLFVKYEDLVSTPEAAMHRIKRFTQLDPSLAQRDDEEVDTGKVDFARDNPWYSTLYERNITDTQVGKHSEVLSPSERETVKRICAPIFKIFDY